MFKSKNILKFSCQKHNQKPLPYDIGQRQLEFDESDEYNNPTTSSCPSLSEFEETRGRNEKIVEEDPFVTGRFCQKGGDNNGKHFLFKQGGSKNSTLKAHGNMQ